LWGDVYLVIVLRSRASEGRSSFRLPFDADGIGKDLHDRHIFRGSPWRVHAA
jgi:hypothetical protein